MKIIRRLSYVALGVAFAQIVFGAIVRITGSGWGCGEHWPKCDGHWVPPFDRPDLIIEVTHRYLALGVTLVALALAIAAWRRRSEAGVAGRGGPLRPAIAAFVVVIATALLGMVTIKLRLNPIVIVLHLALAMSLLATIIIAGIRAGGFGARGAVPLVDSEPARQAASKAWRVARVAAVLAFVVLLLGALTANLGAAAACLGFPTCRVYSSPNAGLVYLQLTHRVFAFLFALHVLGATMMIRRRPVAAVVRRAAWLTLGAVILQIMVAAALVETRLPPVLQSLHQAVGTLVWIAVVIWAVLAHRAVGSEPAHLADAKPELLPSDRDAGARVVRAADPPTGAAVIVAAPAIDADTIARFGDLERAGRTYESAIVALVAEAEAIAATFDESLVVVTAEHAVPTSDDGEAAIPDDSEVAIAAESEPVAAPVPESVAPERAEPVVLPAEVITPAQPVPAFKRPHSVAVIVARGADF